MRPRTPTTIILVISAIILSNCATLKEGQGDEYEVLGSAVSACSYAMIGKYGDTIPDNLTAADFLSVCEKGTPEGYFEVLKKYPLEIKPKGSYYLLLVHDPETKALILFDYSCTSEPDGKVLREPNKYDVNHLELYDPCKGKNW
jgi:hypothetical protein